MKVLHRHCSDHLDTWLRYLPLVEHVLNVRPSSVTGYSAFFLDHRRTPTLLPKLPQHDTTLPRGKEFTDNIFQVWKEVQTCIEEQALCMEDSRPG